MRASRVVQTALRMIYPPTCLACDARVETEQGLCGACWRETRFVTAHPCDACGAPLAGDHAAPGELCDDCLRRLQSTSREFRWSHDNNSCFRLTSDGFYFVPCTKDSP
ncbi:MAG: double zinc ribbon domain-containing protein, partial [Pseudomonadota bacterium]|nr:double zinc ribbon domain-containing protein [Pseudomonadota bacterium]